MRRKVSFLPVDHAPPPPHGIAEERLPAALSEWFEKEWAVPLHSGRAAMTALFRHLRLGREDEVYIATTFDFPHVSACVTCTIFNFCKPSRVLTAYTRAIFVIHEFGVPHPHLEALQATARDRGIPLIEDCAHTVCSVGPAGRVGQLGEWTIVSFPKILGVRHGGALLGRAAIDVPPDPAGWMEAAAAWWPGWADQAARRRSVFHTLQVRFSRLGLTPAVSAGDNVTPWFFPVRVPEPEAMLSAAAAADVDCGHWHGTEIVVYPCHQFLGEPELDRITAAAAHGLQRR